MFYAKNFQILWIFFFFAFRKAIDTSALYCIEPGGAYRKHGATLPSHQHRSAVTVGACEIWCLGHASWEIRCHASLRYLDATYELGDASMQWAASAMQRASWLRVHCSGNEKIHRIILCLRASPVIETW